MIPQRLDALAKAMKAKLVGGPASTEVRGVSIDTRTLQPGDLFVALRGGKTDGHDFLHSAVQKGAAAVLCEAGRAGDGVQPRLEAADALAALGAMAASYREQLTVKVVAITGSCGKSTAKEMTAHLLSEAGPTVHSPRSFNNAIGVPLTLFQADKKTRYVVAELGTNAPGEIDPLAKMTRPHVGVLLNVGEAHLEKLEGREGVFQEKSALWKRLEKKGGTAVFCSDDPWCRRAPDVWKGKTNSFGLLDAHRPDLTAVNIQATPTGVSFEVDGTRVALPLPGRHNVLNALSAMAAGKALGLKLPAMAKRLETFAGLDGRMRPRTIGTVQVVDDTYNANPTSVGAALEYLAELKGVGRKVVILGDMKELGAFGEAKHRALGERLAASREADVFWAVGPLMRLAALEAVARRFPQDKVLISADAGEAVRWIRRGIKDGDFVLVKGSRSMGMEKVVEGIESSLRKEGKTAGAAP